MRFLSRVGALRALLTLLSLLVSVRALAEGECRGDETEYCTVIAEAVRQRNAQRFVEARALFERAHQLAPSARTARGLGDVSLALGRPREAIAYLQEALDSTVKPLTPPLRAEVMQLVARARGLVATLDLSLSPAQAHAFLDGEPLVHPPPVALLDPGPHTLEVRADGHRSDRRAFDAAAGDRFVWTIRLEPVLPQAAAPIPREVQPVPVDRPRPRSTRPARWLLPTGAVLVGVGAVAIAAGVGRFAGHLDDGTRLRASPALLPARHAQWVRSRRTALALTGAGSGVLAAGGAMLAELVPTRHRRWLAPSLLAVGAGLLATGLATQHGTWACNASDEGTLRRCVPSLARHDRGSIFAMVSVPVLTVPIVHAAHWLLGPRAGER
ncbi:MAG: tetratricopeptide repeat protein [Polyangiales bacterium]